MHIEQGPVLDTRGLPLGIVEAIAGQTRADVQFVGATNHAGTTPMAGRRDALTGAAEWILEVEGTGRSTPGLVATVGLGQWREGRPEPAIVTSGDDLRGVAALLEGRARYSASDVLDYLAAR